MFREATKEERIIILKDSLEILGGNYDNTTCCHPPCKELTEEEKKSIEERKEKTKKQIKELEES